VPLVATSSCPAIASAAEPSATAQCQWWVGAIGHPPEPRARDGHDGPLRTTWSRRGTAVSLSAAELEKASGKWSKWIGPT